MKVRHAGSNVIASEGVKSEGKFTIQANAQAFRILSSGLYSDKIAAVLREIGCNAADSHIAAGCPDRPIEVKLPTSLDKDFYIKDFGTGLTHEEITGLFTTYFSSNKSDNNDLTGAFGLGSKSPFSYTGSFAVTTAKDGVQRSYAAHIGADGAPVISLLSECPATPEWPSGMMVSFPINPNDVHEFHSKSQKIFRYFRVKPDLIGGEPILEIQRGVEGSNFYFPVNSERFKSPKVLTGNVAYPLRAERLELPETAIGQRALIEAGISLTMPIGSVMPTASREELEYDPQTRENVLNALTAAGVELAGRLFEKAVEPCPTEWERHVRMRAFRTTLPEGFPAVGALLALLPVSKMECQRIKGLFEDAEAELPEWIGSHMVVAPDLAHTFNVWHVQQYARQNGIRVEKRQVIGGQLARGSHRKGDTIKLPYYKRVGVFYDDSTHACARVRQYVEDNNLDIAIFVTAAYKEAQVNLEGYARRIAEALGGVSLQGTSALGVPLTVQMARGKQTIRQVALEKVYASQEVIFVPLTEGSKFSRDNRVKVADVPATARYYATGYYLAGGVTRFYVPLSPDSKRAVDHGPMMVIAQSFRLLRERGIPLQQIDGVVVLEPGQLVKLKLKENGWKPLFETILESLTAKSTVKELKARLTKMPVIDWSRYSCHRHAGILGYLLHAWRENNAFWKYIKPRLSEFPVLNGLLTEFARTNDPKNPAGIRIFLKAIREHLPFALKGLPEEIDCVDLARLIEKAYPLVKYLDVNTFERYQNVRPGLAYATMKQLLVPKEALEGLLTPEAIEMEQAAAA